MSEPVQAKPAEIKAGRFYHFRDTQEQSVYDWAKENQRVPFTITRVVPEEVEAAYGTNESLWLSTRKDEGGVPPAELARIKGEIDKKLEGQKSLILFGKGSVDYLANFNELKSVVSLLETLADDIYKTGNIVASEIDLGSEDVNRRAAYKSFCRTIQGWPILSAEEQAEKEEDKEFVDSLDVLLEKKAKLSNKQPMENEGKPAPFIEGGWPAKEKKQ